MDIKYRYNKILSYFKENQPTAEIELDYKSNYELVVAVILSAQCTDVRVNKITKDFFERFPNVYELAKSDIDEVYTYIKSCSYPNNKSNYLVNMAKTVVNDYNGEIPSEIDSLRTLPGVGRKSANVLASVLFGKAAMGVDTHVFRVANRLGLVSDAKTPLEVEKQLVKNIPTDLISSSHHWLILHGRYTCLARNPKCTQCKIRFYCKNYIENDIFQLLM